MLAVERKHSLQVIINQLRRPGQDRSRVFGMGQGFLQDRQIASRDILDFVDEQQIGRQPPAGIGRAERSP